MSKVEITTTITPQYLRGKTKDEIIDHVMRLLKENDDLRDAFSRATAHREVSECKACSERAEWLLGKRGSI